MAREACSPQHAQQERHSQEFGPVTPPSAAAAAAQQHPHCNGVATGLDINRSWTSVHHPALASAAHGKSSFGSSVHWGAPDRASGSISVSHRVSDSSSKVWMNSAAAFMRRFSQFGRNGSGQQRPMQAASEQVPMQVLRLALRVGIATGTLPYGVDVANCAVKDRAKGTALAHHAYQHIQIQKQTTALNS
jgi:hypothetical protein